MSDSFPSPVPEIPVTDIDAAADYHAQRFGFNIDWRDDGGGGIGCVSKGPCRLFLTNHAFRATHGNLGPLVIWLNLNNKQEVDALHADWSQRGARIVSPPESKPWLLHEFTAADLDGNLLRVFYDFRGDV